MTAVPLPASIVVDANGSYWRNFGQYFSKCPVSDDNDPIDIVAIYDWVDPGRESSAADEDGASEADKAAPGHHESVGERQGRQPAPHLPDPQPPAPEGSVDADFETVYEAICLAYDPPSEAHSAFESIAARLRQAERKAEYAWKFVGRCEVAEGKVREAEARVRELEAALRELVGWQPHTDKVLATLHPQHREAIEKARALLGFGEGQERQT